MFCIARSILTTMILIHGMFASLCLGQVDPATEWRRSNPDVAVYIPQGGDHNDGDNEHFLVFKAPQSDNLLAMWTQSSVEAYGDNHIVLARSNDGVHWSRPQWIIGTHKGTQEMQASWAFPVVSRSGRLYCFYTKSHQGVPGGRSGVMGGLYSDDDGRSWTAGPDIIVQPAGENPGDLTDKAGGGDFIVWQKPVRDSKGRWLAGFTAGGSYFMRFDNIDAGPDIANLQITWLPLEGKGLVLPRYVHPTLIEDCAEPSIVLLPDRRLFITMRTRTGHIWYSVSTDDGETWRDPEVLRNRDYGEPFKQPLAPCPIYRLKDSRFLLLFHNNDHYASNIISQTPLPWPLASPHRPFSATGARHLLLSESSGPAPINPSGLANPSKFSIPKERSWAPNAPMKSPPTPA